MYKGRYLYYTFCAVHNTPYQCFTYIAHAHTHTHTHTHTHAHIHTHTHTHAHIHTHTHTHKLHVHARAHTHTHTGTCWHRQEHGRCTKAAQVLHERNQLHCVGERHHRSGTHQLPPWLHRLPRPLQEVRPQPLRICRGKGRMGPQGIRL